MCPKPVSSSPRITLAAVSGSAVIELWHGCPQARQPTSMRAPNQSRRSSKRVAARLHLVIYDFCLATLMVIQGVVPGMSDHTVVVEQTIATLWAGV